MKLLRLVSLGAWCRPTHQIAVCARARPDVQAVKGPFDWTVTSFRALQTCLDAGFDPGQVLGDDGIICSHSRSARCTCSGLVFQHAIPPDALAGVGQFAAGDRIPLAEGLRPVVEAARGRFRHTFGAFGALRSGGAPILFVRWQRQGHPDVAFPEAFAGETPDSMRTALTGFLGHDRFHVLSVSSRITPDRTAPFPDPIVAYSTRGRFTRCVIRERKGWNGDQSNSYRGDESSWRAALDRAISDLV